MINSKLLRKLLRLNQHLLYTFQEDRSILEPKLLYLAPHNSCFYCTQDAEKEILLVSSEKDKALQDLQKVQTNLEKEISTRYPYLLIHQLNFRITFCRLI